MEEFCLFRLHMFLQLFHVFRCLYSFYSSVFFKLSVDTGLRMCMIALLYLFSFHRTCFSSSNGIPINVSSKNHIIFYKKVFSLHVEQQGKIWSNRLISQCVQMGVVVSTEFFHSSEDRCHSLPVCPGQLTTFHSLMVGNTPKTTKVARGHQASGFPTDPAVTPAAVAAWLREGLPFLGLGHATSHHLL